MNQKTKNVTHPPRPPSSKKKGQDKNTALYLLHCTALHPILSYPTQLSNPFRDFHALLRQQGSPYPKLTLPLTALDSHVLVHQQGSPYPKLTCLLTALDSHVLVHQQMQPLPQANPFSPLLDSHALLLQQG